MHNCIAIDLLSNLIIPIDILYFNAQKVIPLIPNPLQYGSRKLKSPEISNR